MRRIKRITAAERNTDSRRRLRQVPLDLFSMPWSLPHEPFLLLRFSFPVPRTGAKVKAKTNSAKENFKQSQDQETSNGSGYSAFQSHKIYGSL